jgi:Tfp pilus assembly protein PilF
LEIKTALFNLAVCYEKIQNIETAKKYYEQYLTKDTNPDSKWYKIVKKKLEILK